MTHKPFNLLDFKPSSHSDPWRESTTGIFCSRALFKIRGAFIPITRPGVDIGSTGVQLTFLQKVVASARHRIPPEQSEVGHRHLFTYPVPKSNQVFCLSTHVREVIGLWGLFRHKCELEFAISAEMARNDSNEISMNRYRSTAYAEAKRRHGLST
jgi:hypothetical protein